MQSPRVMSIILFSLIKINTLIFPLPLNYLKIVYYKKYCNSRLKKEFTRRWTWLVKKIQNLNQLYTWVPHLFLYKKNQPLKVERTVIQVSIFVYQSPSTKKCEEYTYIWYTIGHRYHPFNSLLIWKINPWINEWYFYLKKCL